MPQPGIRPVWVCQCEELAGDSLSIQEASWPVSWTREQKVHTLGDLAAQSDRDPKMVDRELASLP